MLPLAALCQVWSPSVHTHECLSAQEGRGQAIRELPGLDLCVQGKFSCPAPRGCSSSNLPSCLLCFPDFCLNSQGIPQLLGTPCIVRCLCKPLRCPCAPSGTPVPPSGTPVLDLFGFQAGRTAPAWVHAHFKMVTTVPTPEPNHTAHAKTLLMSHWSTNMPVIGGAWVKPTFRGRGLQFRSKGCLCTSNSVYCLQCGYLGFEPQLLHP